MSGGFNVEYKGQVDRKVRGNTGCSLNIVMILKYIPNSGLSVYPLDVSECTQWQVKHQRCCRTCRVQKNNNILRKNTIFNKLPV